MLKAYQRFFYIQHRLEWILYTDICYWTFKFFRAKDSYIDQRAYY